VIIDCDVSKSKVANRQAESVEMSNDLQDLIKYKQLADVCQATGTKRQHVSKGVLHEWQDNIERMRGFDDSVSLHKTSTVPMLLFLILTVGFMHII